MLSFLLITKKLESIKKRWRIVLRYTLVAYLWLVIIDMNDIDYRFFGLKGNIPEDLG
jgi:hypothetical protein